MKKCLILVGCLLTLVACAEYKAVRQPNLSYDLECQQNKVICNGLELMIKPIHLKTDLRNYFDDDLIEYGVLPIQVNLCNRSSETLYFNVEGLNLIDPTNSRLPVMTSQAVVDKAEKSYWRTAGWTVAFGLFGLIPSAINVSNTNKKIQADYESRTIKSGNMVPGSITEGLAFFSVPPDISSLEGWRLVVALKNGGNNDTLFVEVGMHGSIEPRPKEDKTNDKKTGTEQPLLD